jgi:hypothetical protein
MYLTHYCNPTCSTIVAQLRDPEGKRCVLTVDLSCWLVALHCLDVDSVVDVSEELKPSICSGNYYLFIIVI